MQGIKKHMQLKWTHAKLKLNKYNTKLNICCCCCYLMYIKSILFIYNKIKFSRKQVKKFDKDVPNVFS